MATSANKIILQSSDNTKILVDKEIAMELLTVKAFFDEPDASAELMLLPNVSGECLSKIIEYCKAYVDFRSRQDTEEEIKKYNDKFVKGLRSESLKELICGANYLDVKYLLDVLNQAAADKIKNKSVKYVRAFFGIKNDFTPEEERKIREENEWAYEGVDPDDDDPDDN